MYFFSIEYILLLLLLSEWRLLWKTCSVVRTHIVITEFMVQITFCVEIAGLMLRYCSKIIFIYLHDTGNKNMEVICIHCPKKDLCLYRIFKAFIISKNLS